MWIEIGYLSVGLLGGSGITFLVGQERLRRRLAWDRDLYEKSLMEAGKKILNAYGERDEAVRKLESWRPDAKSLDEAWAEAEYMANRRKLLQAGRASVPRSDAGDPAVLHRATMRGGPRKPLGGI